MLHLGHVRRVFIFEQRASIVYSVVEFNPNRGLVSDFKLKPMYCSRHGGALLVWHLKDVLGSGLKGPEVADGLLSPKPTCAEMMATLGLLSKWGMVFGLAFATAEL